MIRGLTVPASWEKYNFNYFDLCFSCLDGCVCESVLIVF